jgi:hypothetical protein
LDHILIVDGNLVAQGTLETCSEILAQIFNNRPVGLGAPVFHIAQLVELGEPVA